MGCCDMYSLLHELLSDQKGGDVFTLFGFWHFLYMALTFTVIAAMVYRLKGTSEHIREKTVKRLLNVAFGLYILDFFLMPLAYGEIDIEKLPFHACTAMCVMCFLSWRVSWLEKYRSSFAILGFLSNIVYLVYPAGIMWHGVHPLSYRVIQTLLFHCVMTVYGFLALFFESEQKRICRLDLFVVVSMTLWAMLGNSVYNGTSGDYSHFFNWFFVVRDPFYVISESISPFVMPFLNVALFFGVERVLRFLFRAVKRRVT